MKCVYIIYVQYIPPSHTSPPEKEEKKERKQKLKIVPFSTPLSPSPARLPPPPRMSKRSFKSF